MYCWYSVLKLYFSIESKSPKNDPLIILKIPQNENITNRAIVAQKSLFFADSFLSPSEKIKLVTPQAKKTIAKTISKFTNEPTNEPYRFDANFLKVKLVCWTCMGMLVLDSQGLPLPAWYQNLFCCYLSPCNWLLHYAGILFRILAVIYFSCSKLVSELFFNFYGFLLFEQNKALELSIGFEVKLHLRCPVGYQLASHLQGLSLALCVMVSSLQHLLYFVSHFYIGYGRALLNDNMNVCTYHTFPFLD